MLKRPSKSSPSRPPVASRGIWCSFTVFGVQVHQLIDRLGVDHAVVFAPGRSLPPDVEALVVLRIFSHSGNDYPGEEQELSLVHRHAVDAVPLCELVLPVWDIDVRVAPARVPPMAVRRLVLRFPHSGNDSHCRGIALRLYPAWLPSRRGGQGNGERPSGYPNHRSWYRWRTQTGACK